MTDTSPSKTIECEVRALLTESQYEQLKSFFGNVAEQTGSESQETRYFDGPHDLRLQKSDRYAKVWLKKGAMHDEAREEVEVRFAARKFEGMERLFTALGYKTAIVWLRHRLSYKWDDVTVALDHTKGYGHVLELEMMSTEADKLATLDALREKLAMLGHKPTPKPVLHERFTQYRENWKTLIGWKDAAAQKAGEPAAKALAALGSVAVAKSVEQVVEDSAPKAEEAQSVPVVSEIDEAMEVLKAVIEDEPVIKTMHDMIKTPA